MREFPIRPYPPRSPVTARPPTGRCLLLVALVVALGSVVPAAPVRAAEDGGTAAAPRADAALAFTEGVLAFHDQDFEQARDRFEEAVRWAPEDGTAWYWLGLTYLNLDRPDEAARALAASLDAGGPPGVGRAEVRARLDEAEERARSGAPEAALVPAPDGLGSFAVLPQAPWLDGRLYLGLGSDSNPNLLPDDLVLVTPDGELVDGAESDTVALADARIAFQAVDEDAGRTLGVVLHGSRSAYDAFDYLDLDRFGAVVQAAFGADPRGYLTGPLGYSRVPLGWSRWALLLQAGASRDFLDGFGFAERAAGAATLALNWRGGSALGGQSRLALSYRDTDFDDDPAGAAGEISGRSGEEIAAELAQYLFFGRRDRYLRLSVESAERDAGAAFDASSLGLAGELSLPVAERVTLYADAALRTDDYDEPVSNPFDPVGTPREDDELRVGGSVVVRIVDHLSLSGRVTWIDHDIDLPAGFATPDLSYERTLATVGLSWTFQKAQP